MPAPPQVAGARRAWHNDNQRITPNDLIRIGALGQRGLMYALSLLLVKKSNGEHLPFGEIGWIGESCQVNLVSGDRSTGLTMQVAAGMGLEKIAGADAVDDAHLYQVFEPIVVEAAFNFVTTASHASLARIDRVFLKRGVTLGENASLDTINPTTKVITPATLATERIYRTNASDGFAYVIGTPGGAAASPPVGYTLENLVAEITIQPGSGSLAPGDLADSRKLLELNHDLQPGLGALDAADVGVDSPLTDAHVQEALERLTTDLSTVAGATAKGLFYHGGVVWKDTATVTLRRGQGRGGTNAEMAIEIDGVVLVKTDAGLDFSMVSHIEGTEAANTWYYLYASASGATIVPHISATAPVLPGAGGKVGYHPTNTTWRWLGSMDPTLGAVYNDNSSNLAPFVTRRDEWKLRDGRPPGGTHTLSLSAPAGTTYEAISLAGKVPPCAVEALVFISTVGTGTGGTGYLHFGSGHLIGLTSGTNPGSVVDGGTIDGDHFMAWIAVDASQRIAYALNAAETYTTIAINVLGWR